MSHESSGGGGGGEAGSGAKDALGKFFSFFGFISHAVLLFITDDERNRVVARYNAAPAG